jgi:hypothetical protein
MTAWRARIQETHICAPFSGPHRFDGAGHGWRGRQPNGERVAPRKVPWAAVTVIRRSGKQVAEETLGGPGGYGDQEIWETGGRRTLGGKRLP